jgi:dipeptidyl aminopeptidase/acylaminoacyl peptidase
MKRLWFLFLILVALPVSAQNDALLLYTTQEDGVVSVLVFNADTGEATLITETDSYHRADWSPDGRIWVVDNVVAWDDDQGRFRFFHAETGEASILSEDLILNIDQCFPALLWSPDGQSLAYATGTADERLLHLRHGLNQSSTTLPFAEGEYLDRWSDNGAFIRVDEGSGGRLLAAEDGREVLEGESIQFSPDQRFVEYRENEEIWLYDLATGERLNLEIRGWIQAWLPTFMLISSERDEILWRYDIETRELISLEITGSVEGHSPSQRYMAINYANSGDVFYLYDSQDNRLTPLDLGYPTRFVGWTEHETQMLLYADFEANTPQTLLRYDFTSAETETLFETDGLIWSASEADDWLIIHYSPVVRNNNNAKLFLRNRETGVEFEVDMIYDRFLPGDFVSISPDRHWLVLNADNAVYLVDLSGANGEPQRLATNTSLNYAVYTRWSGDSRYMAFNVEGKIHLLNVESGTLEILPETIVELIGWQDTGQPYVILCTGGGDGNA